MYRANCILKEKIPKFLNWTGHDFLEQSSQNNTNISLHLQSPLEDPAVGTHDTRKKKRSTKTRVSHVQTIQQ
jgi:hypothetical protein